MTQYLVVSKMVLGGSDVPCCFIRNIRFTPESVTIPRCWALMERGVVQKGNPLLPSDTRWGHKGFCLVVMALTGKDYNYISYDFVC